jgi:hypothetical protein
VQASPGERGSADSLDDVIRRCLALAAVAGALFAATGCSTVDKPAATVNGTEISTEQMLAEIKSLEVVRGEGGTSAVLNDGVALEANSARGWLSNRVRWQIALDALGDTPLDPAALSQINQELADGTAGWADAPPEFQDLVVRGIAAEAQLGDVALQEAARTADVDISSTIGRWVPETGEIVALGS